MPNPFMKLGTPSISKPADDRPHAVKPIPEEYVGENNPYRGIQTHGVEPTGKPLEGPEYDEEVPGFYEPVKEEPDPIPVRVVTAGGKELRRSNIRSFVLGTTPIAIAGRNPGRIKIEFIVPSTNADTVWLGTNGSINAALGTLPLANSVGKLTHTSTSEDEFWAVATANNPIIYIYEEYSVKE